jgi:HEAT repeat protein
MRRSVRTVDALERVGQAADAGDVDYLLDALAGTNRVARWSAARKLGLLKTPEAFEPLLRLARDSGDEALQANCIIALGDMGDPRACEPLHSIATDPTPFGVRTNAMKSLAMLGDRRGVQMLAGVVADPNLLEPYSMARSRPGISVGPAKRRSARQIVRLEGV